MLLTLGLQWNYIVHYTVLGKVAAERPWILVKIFPWLLTGSTHMVTAVDWGEKIRIDKFYASVCLAVFRKYNIVDDM